MESHSDENAEAFAKFIAKTYVPSEEHKLKFTIRGWLNDIFKKMFEEKMLVGKDGKKLENFGFYNNKMPIRMAKDKSITAKFFVNFSEVDAVIKYLSEYIRAPSCTFLNPETMNEDRKKRQAQSGDKKKEYLNKKR